MATVVQAPTFGLESCATPISRSAQGEMMELTDGLSKTEYLRTVTTTNERKRSVLTAYGITETGTGTDATNLFLVSGNYYSFNYKSASITWEEEVIGPEYCATNENTGGDDGYHVAGGKAIDANSADDKLQHAVAMLWPRVKITVEVDAYGKVPTSDDEFVIKPGTVVTSLILMAQTDTFGICSTASGAITNLKVQSLSANDNDGEWNNWTATLVKYVENPTAACNVSPLVESLDAQLAGISLFSAGDIASDYYKITISHSLTEDGFAELTETIEEYDSADVFSTIPSLAY